MSEELPDPRDFIIARQAIELEQLRRDFNDLIDQVKKLNDILAQARSVDLRFYRF